MATHARQLQAMLDAEEAETKAAANDAIKQAKESA